MDILIAVASFALSHWPFAVAVAVLSILGQLLKNVVFPDKGWYTRRPVWLFWWGRKTLPFQTAGLGIILGLFWHHPEGTIHNTVESMVYFGLAGVAAVWAYEAVKGLLKKKGIEIPVSFLK